MVLAETLQAQAFLARPVCVGSLQLKNRVLLAPLAGVSDVPFRRISQELGAGLTYVEMLSSTAILRNNKRTFQMMARHASESILGVQVTGSTAEDVAGAVAVLHKEGFDTIDINMGCPVRKVVSVGCGSGILKDPERITETVVQSRAATNKPLSAKFRLGYTRDAVNVTDTVTRVVKSCVDMYTIHGRTRSENYSTPCDHAGIRQGMDATPTGFDHVVRVANGDVFTLKDAQTLQQSTSSHALMVSRGALGNPWVFEELIGVRQQSPEFCEWLDVVSRHVSYQEEHYGSTPLATILMRKHLLWYVKGFPQSKAFRERFNRVTDFQEVRSVLKEFATVVPATLRRFEQGEPMSLGSNYDPKYEMDRELDRGVGDEEMA